MKHDAISFKWNNLKGRLKFIMQVRRVYEKIKPSSYMGKSQISRTNYTLLFLHDNLKLAWTYIWIRLKPLDLEQTIHANKHKYNSYNYLQILCVYVCVCGCFSMV